MAASGAEALATIPSVAPDVAVVDIGLPDMEGFEVARQLREHAALAGTVLIGLTGYGQDEDRRRSLEAGFDLHLVKPLDAATLQRLLETPATPNLDPR